MSTLLTEALATFGLANMQTAFLQHSENLTYRVDDEYLLRIHKAAEGLHVDHDPQIRCSELTFLRHLYAKGLNVHRPIAEATLHDGTMATLLTWLPGTSLTKDTLTPELLRQAGTLAYQLHEAARSFREALPRTYGTAHTQHLAVILADMAERYAFPADEKDALLAACAVIGERLDTASDAFIPIHADLSASNLLLTPDGLAPIDFSLLGLGHPMHDLSILMGNISSQAQRQAVAEGYTSAGGRIDLPLLDAGLALGLLEALVFHADTWPRGAWFAPRLTRWVGEMLRPLAEGRPLLAETMYLVNLK